MTCNSISSTLRSLLLVLLALLVVQQVHALGSVRDGEIAQCLPGELASWGDGRDRPAVSSPMAFVYDHAGAPAWFDEAQVLAMVGKAAEQWSQCGISASVSVRSPAQTLPSMAVLVGWSESGSAGNFGLANFGQRSLTLGPAAFALLRNRNPAHDARETLQMVVSHEMGHLFGLMSHSRRCVDVTSNYDNGKGEKCLARDVTQLRLYPEYRASLPTACDIERCRLANGQAQGK
jgi:hypothetical protein